MDLLKHLEKAWHTRYREATQKGEETAVSDVQDDDNLGGIFPFHMDGKKIKLAVQRGVVAELTSFEYG